MKRLIKVLGILLAVVLGFGGYLFFDANNIRITSYDIHSPKIPSEFEGYRIAVFSDYHNAPYYEQALEKTRKQKPEVIFLTGDMINDDEREHESTKALIQGLVQIAPVYSVTGNHEMWNPGYSDFKKFLAESGVHLLNYQGVMLKKDNAYINLYGVDDFSITDDQIKDSARIKQLENFSQKWVSPSGFHILLMHRANAFPYIKDLHFDLICSGHLHGGKMQIPIISDWINEKKDNIFYYAKGLFSEGSAKMVVSRGMDRNLKMPRIFNPPEIVILTLKK